MGIRWLCVIRDVVIVTFFTMVGGFIFIGGLTSQGEYMKVSMAVAAFLLPILGFCLCGCLTIENRWKHLFIVASGVWVIYMSYYLLPQKFSMLDWVFSILNIFIPMAIGGAFSLILVKAPEQKEKPDEQKQ